MQKPYTRLNWDSALFGYPVAAIDGSQLSNTVLSDILQHLTQQGYKLIYFYSDSDNKYALEKEGKLVDIKVIYEKPITKTGINPSPIRSFSSREDYHRLLTLALLSGKYSRFHTDSCFVNKEFEKLYEEWIKKSVSREIADEVLVYEESGEIMGMVTIGFEKTTARIGLIAVQDHLQGRQIGKKLIETSLSKAHETGCSILEVATQKTNEAACRFYEKNGFTVRAKKWIYHFWLNN